MHLHHVARDLVKHKTNGGKIEDSQHVHEGLNWRDGITIGLAIATLGLAALGVEDLTKTNGDIIFDASTAIGAHPLHVIYRKLSYFFIP